MGIIFKLNKNAYSNCRSYSYKRGDHSIFEKLCEPYWNFCVKLIPKSVTANLLTLLGFICSTLAFFLMYMFDVNNKKYDHIYIYMGILLFLYSTLDAIDGKQARRTNTSSALGQLFDHGCDAITSCLFIMIGVKTIGLTKGWVAFWIVAYIQLLVFVLSWLEHYTKTYNTANGPFGVTEINLAGIALCVFRGLKGPGIYQRLTFKNIIPAKIHSFFGYSLLSLSLSTILIISSFILIAPSTANFIYKGIINAKKKKKEASLLLALFVGFLISEYYFYRTTTTPKNELICFLILAIYSAFYTLHMNLSTLLKIKMPYVPIPIIVYYIFMALLFVKRTMKPKFLNAAALTEINILYYMLGFAIFYLFDYSYTLITNICKELGITFLFLKRKKK
ncbi:choline/ethanolaminephosphotransferase, putative [Plasmodium vinckei lentum]|uniref:Choline/ethanolaminephosphotransferase, putative n=1 Tax=Plasmodium vinckei lentum TaxID=138297 RepID=A0A6V7SCR5_PLAVN|nr:choline/ethanolaminephosphotransferase, putative [Plasmodium vinckei lentum]